MKYAWINRNITDLRAQPKFRSERKSQLLFGETIEIGSKRNGYVKAYQADEYHGWVDMNAVEIVSKRGFNDVRKGKTHIVTVPECRLTPESKRTGRRVPFLFFGTRIKGERVSSRQAVIIAPDGNRYRVSMKNLDAIASIRKRKFSGRDIIKDMKKFIGTPYLWGGMSPYGFDCSGLVQAVYGRFDIKLARDSKDQRKEGLKVDIDDIAAGDLLFFPGHVAVALDRYRIIHASLKEGGVYTNSLEPGAEGCREDLYNSYLETRRVLK